MNSLYFFENWRKKSLIIFISVCLLTLFCNDSFAWGSLNTASTLLGVPLNASSHQYILQEAYKNLEKNDPEVFVGSNFPKLNEIMKWEGQHLTLTWGTSGDGPDSPEAKTKYSWHEYNPKTNKGEAPAQAADFYQNLESDFSQSKKGKDPAKDAAYLAHFIADVSCPYHVNGMPADDAKNLEFAAKSTGDLQLGYPTDNDVHLQSDQIGHCLEWTGKGMGRSLFLTDAEINRYHDTLWRTSSEYYFSYPMGAPIRGSGGKDENGTPCNNWKKELNNWSNIFKQNEYADWFDPWYSDGFLVIHTKGPTDQLSPTYNLTEQSSTHTWWEWYAFNNYSRPIYDETKVGYSKEFLKIQKEKGNGNPSNIVEFTKKIASNTRDNQEAILKESTTKDTQRDIDSELGKAYQEAITDVYTAWRASFSALRPEVKFMPNSGSGVQKIDVTIKNKAQEDAKNIKINVRAVDENEIVKNFVIDSNKEVPDRIPKNQSIVMTDKWELDIPSEFSGPLYLLVEVTGKFEETPDSGKSVLREEVPLPAKWAWVLTEKKNGVAKTCWLTPSEMSGELKAHSCEVIAGSNDVAGKASFEWEDCACDLNSKVRWTEPPDILFPGLIRGFTTVQLEIDGSCSYGSLDRSKLIQLSLFEGDWIYAWVDQFEKSNEVELSWYDWNSRDILDNSLSRIEHDDFDWGQSDPVSVQKTYDIQVYPATRTFTTDPQPEGRKLFLTIGVNTHGVDRMEKNLVFYNYTWKEVSSIIPSALSEMAPSSAVKLEKTTKESSVIGESAGGQAAEDSKVDRLIEDLNDPDSDVRKEAAMSLRDLGDVKAFDALISALRDKNWSVRMIAAEALGAIGDSRALQPLIQATNDEHEYVRQSAAGALGDLGDSRAVEPLIDALSHEDPLVRSTAADSLGELGDSRAVEPLIQSLSDKWSVVRTSAARALGLLDDARAVEPLIKALGDEGIMGYVVREAAASSLGQLGDARAGEPLIQALNDEDKYVRRSAAGALGELGDSSAIDPLIDALDDEDKEVVLWAHYSLAKLGKTEYVDPLLVSLKDEEPHIRWTTADALGDLGDSRAVEPLIEALNDEDSSVRSSAAEALGKIGDSRARAPLLSAKEDESSYVREAVAAALEKL